MFWLILITLSVLAMLRCYFWVRPQMPVQWFMFVSCVGIILATALGLVLFRWALFFMANEWR